MEPMYKSYPALRFRPQCIDPVAGKYVVLDYASGKTVVEHPKYVVEMHPWRGKLYKVALTRQEADTFADELNNRADVGTSEIYKGPDEKKKRRRVRLLKK